MSTADAYKRPESVLVVIYSVAGKILLLQRKQPEDFWQSVTGSLHKDETPLAAAHRELHEETGLSAEGMTDHDLSWCFPILPAWRARYAPEVTENREYVFSLCLQTELDIKLNPSEHRAWCWLSCAQALVRVSSYTNRDAIQMLANARGWPT